jgi:hypothetical protein
MSLFEIITFREYLIINAVLGVGLGLFLGWMTGL